jgi:hypothetical protein
VTLPFTHIPKRMKIEFVYFMIPWMNAFLVKSRILPTILPPKLLMWWRLDYRKHCCVPLETYCEVHNEPTPTNRMALRTHEAIALGSTGNLQGSVKIYFINMGRVLKRCSFTPMPMSDRVIRRVNPIGQRERQGRSFRFLNQQKEPFEWTDTVSEDNLEFQGLLEDDEESAPYPDISSELPGVELDEEEREFQAVLDKPKPDFQDMAAAALHNAGINADNRVRAAQALALADTERGGAALVEANEDEIVYKITFNLPNVGLPLPNACWRSLFPILVLILTLVSAGRPGRDAESV